MKKSRSVSAASVSGAAPRFPTFEDLGRATILAEKRDRALRAVARENLLLREEIARLRAQVVELGGVPSRLDA